MTAHFASLPNELIREILKLTHPEDLENFAQVSRHVLSLAVPFLEEHRALIRRYHTLRNPTGYRTIANLLNAVITDPRIAPYVKKVELGPLEEPEPELDFDSPNVYTKEELEIFTTAALDNQCLKLPSCTRGMDEREFWYDEIKYGSDDILLAILLPHLPNLAALSVEGEPFWYDSAIQQASSATKPTLCKLTHIRLNPCGTSRLYLTKIQKFCALPSLRVLAAPHALGVNCLSKLAQDTISNVTHLKLWESCIDSKALYEFLRGFPKLQSFTYSYDDAFLHATHDAWLIRSSLLAYCKTTLHSLTLLTPSQRYPCFMGSLKGFDTLKELYTEWSFIIPTTEPLDGPHLNESLPASLVRLKIHDSIGREKYLYEYFIRSAQYAKEHRLQKLKWLVFGGTRVGWSLETMDRDLKKTCSNLGITLIFSPYAPKSGD
ncbi:hypothetical protein IMSHALPRED_009395 [Imshaugia aleurites]|uniref:F-box domain-containing protein n=1 Tax=Imshaugia aleurites TaxID=172621 RepID=A0A8H3FWI4_9LECA|nr:hypothetical protein IMSHALPRED_009395 [Imshaugia aleurites]